MSEIIPLLIKLLPYDEAYEKYAKIRLDQKPDNRYVSFTDLESGSNKEIYKVNTGQLYYCDYYKHGPYWYVVSPNINGEPIVGTIINDKTKYISWYKWKRLQDDPMLPITDMIREYVRYNRTKNAAKFD